MKNDKPKKFVSSLADIPEKEDYVEVEVPEWGTEEGPAVFLLRHLTQGERRRFTAKGELGLLGQMTETEKERELARWKDWYDTGKREVEILRLCYVKGDGSGSPLFSEDDARRLMEHQDTKPVLRLIIKAEEENLLTVQSTEDFRKNA